MSACVQTCVRATIIENDRTKPVHFGTSISRCSKNAYTHAHTREFTHIWAYACYLRIQHMGILSVRVGGVNIRTQQSIVAIYTCGIHVAAMYAMLLTCRSEMRKALNTPLVPSWDALISLRDPHTSVVSIFERWCSRLPSRFNSRTYSRSVSNVKNEQFASMCVCEYVASVCIVQPPYKLNEYARVYVWASNNEQHHSTGHIPALNLSHTHTHVCFSQNRNWFF